MNKYLNQIVLICVVVAGLSFFAGYQVGKGKAQIPAAQMGQGNMVNQRATESTSPNRGTQNRPTGNQGMQPVAGEIISLDDNTLTIKAQDGSSKIVILSDSTKVNLTTEGSTADLETGVQVTVIGTANRDGSVTAQSVAIGSGFSGPAGGNPPGAPQQ